MYLDRILFTATRYPPDYGFIPETLAADGDPLDALALVTEPTFPGCRIRPLGGFLMEDQGKADHKVLGVPVADPLWREANDLADLPGHVMRELEHFFAVCEDLEAEKPAVIGRQPRPDAESVLERARLAWADRAVHPLAAHTGAIQARLERIEFLTYGPSAPRQAVPRWRVAVWRGGHREVPDRAKP